MPAQTPADVLRAAATKLREFARVALDPTAAFLAGHRADLVAAPNYAAMDPSIGRALADWLEEEAQRYEAAVTAAHNVFHDDPAGRDAFVTTGPGAPSGNALTVARQILGTQETR